MTRILSALLLLLLTRDLSLLAAPAPMPRREGRTAVTGRWRLHWGTGWYVATLTPGGHWRCEDEQGVWLGEWTYEDSRLSVRESKGGVRYEWAVTLDGTPQGRTLSGVEIKLTR